MPARGQKPGHPDAGATAGAPMAWAEYVDALVAEHGSLAALCERMAALRGFREDVESIGRALRRLRARGGRSGGTWGDRVLRAFGLPASVHARLRFMGQYHSRFVDLPVPLATDLVRLWDRPPTTDSRTGRLWLSLARATLALRQGVHEEAAQHLAAAGASAAGDPPGQIEVALGSAFLDSHARPQELPAALAAVPELLAEVTGADGDCLRARYTGQLAHSFNRAGDIERGLELHLALPDGAGTHPFARSRRANGIAYALFRRGEVAAALANARLAATFAGDAGHVRLRAMALLMVSRIGGASAEGHDARTRARAIANELADATLLGRCEAAERDNAGA
jgi:hypothetical protein